MGVSIKTAAVNMGLQVGLIGAARRVAGLARGCSKHQAGIKLKHLRK
jgi:hypothetical protein